MRMRTSTAARRTTPWAPTTAPLQVRLSYPPFFLCPPAAAATYALPPPLAPLPADYTRALDLDKQLSGGGGGGGEAGLGSSMM